MPPRGSRKPKGTAPKTGDSGKTPARAAVQASPLASRAQSPVTPGPSNPTIAPPASKRQIRVPVGPAVPGPDETPSRRRRGPPVEVIPEVVSSYVKPRRVKPKIAMCLRCSKRVYKDRVDICCSRKDAMTRCTYCQDHHAKCLPVSAAAPALRLRHC